MPRAVAARPDNELTRTEIERRIAAEIERHIAERLEAE